jgi:tetratricopeptide (TPR) repeat protein
LPRTAASPEPARDDRTRRIRLAVLGLTLAIAALGIWAYRSIRRESSSPDALWEQAQEDLHAGRFDRVERAVARLARLREPTPLDWFLSAQLAVARNHPDQAVVDLARVPDDHYMAAKARLLAGQIELRRHRFRFAEQAFCAAVVIDPTLAQPHRELIYIYGLQLRRTRLKDEFLALSGLEALTFREAFHWCLLQNDSWEPVEAASLMAECVAADPGDRWSRLAFAENDRRLGRFDEAESVLAGLPENDPEALAARVRIAFDRFDDDRAEGLLAAGRADDPILALLRGRLALARQDSATALHHFRVAYAADPDRRETLSGLIAALLRVGDVNAAAPLREIAARREKLGSLIQRAAMPGARDDPALHRQLGAACAALNRNAEARAWYELAIVRDPLDTEAQQALFRLRGAAGGETPSILRAP